MREIGRFKADLPKNMWHLTQQIQRLSVGLLQVNSKTMERYDSVVGEAATPFSDSTNFWVNRFTHSMRENYSDRYMSS